MVLSLAAAILHGSAYAIYLAQVYSGNSTPNPASWSVWAFMTILNALSYWRASKDALATTQFFTGSVACFLVWLYALLAGRFSGLDALGWIVLVLCILACLVWWQTQNAAYASVMVGVILFISSIPTIDGVWHKGVREQALPWWLWTIAFAITSANVMRRHRKNSDLGLLMVVPLVGIFIHFAVAVAAK